MDTARTMAEGQRQRPESRSISGHYKGGVLRGRLQWWAALTLQREWVRWRGELMSLGVDDRSPSTAEASEMTEGWREWHGLTRTAATKTGREGKKRKGLLSWGCVWPPKVVNSLIPFNIFLKKKKNSKAWNYLQSSAVAKQQWKQLQRLSLCMCMCVRETNT